MTGKQLRIEPDALGMHLDDIGDGLIGEPGPDLAASCERDEIAAQW
jgi:hypothetical protein